MPSAPPPPAVLLCRVGTRRIAFPAREVTGVLPVPPLWRPPTLPAPLLGFVSLPDATLPVLSLAALLGEAAETVLDLYAHLVRLRGAGALAVDRALGFVEPRGTAPVAAGASLDRVVVAELDLGADGVAHLLDPQRLLADAERQALAHLTAQAGARRAVWARV